MNKNSLSLIIGVLGLTFGLIALILSLKTEKNSNTNVPSQTNEQIKIAYVNIDTLLNNYDLYNYLMLQLAEKQKQLEQKLNSKMLSLQRRSYDLQQKYANHLITTMTYEKEAQKLLEEQQKLSQWQQQKALELQDDQANITMRVYDSILVAVREFNKDQKYNFIFSNNITATGRSLLYADTLYDITDTIVTILNQKAQNTLLQLDTTKVSK